MNPSDFDSCVQLVIEHDKPIFLRCCLESLRRAGWRWPIVVCLDGPVSKRTEQLCKCLADEWMVFRERMGCVKHVSRSLQHAVSFGTKHVCWMPGDAIVRKDALKIVLTDQMSGKVGSFIRVGQEREACWYASFGVLAESSLARDIANYIDSWEWAWKPRPGFREQVIVPEYEMDDAIITRYFILNGILTRWARVSTMGHIGVVGMNSKEDHYLKRYAGHDPTEWLGIAAKMFNPKETTTFCPPDFVFC